MAAAVKPRKKCQYWEKCFRKNKQHIEEFIHPGEDDENLESDKKVEKVKKIEKEDKNPSESKPQRLVHDISNADDDLPAWKKQTTSPSKPTEKRKVDNSPSPSTSSEASPVKKVKIDESNEIKITVDYSKKKGEKTIDSVKPSSEIASTSTNKPTPAVIQYKSKREKCKYWDKCYQTAGPHKKQYVHPGDDDDDTSQEDTDKKKTRADTNTPLNPLEDGGTVEFDSGFKLKRVADTYTCTCDGFTNQKAPEDERTCKHLKEYNGEDFEKARLAPKIKAKKGGIKSHISVSLLLAHKYDEKVHNPVGWWISEKLDGVRAYWNGNCFYSRLGNAFFAPDWFTKDLPKDKELGLDGELFGGRGQFQSTVSIVKTPESPKWKDIKYHVFDAPNLKDKFVDRMYKIKDYFEEHQPKYAVFVEQTKCTSKEQLDQKLTRVLNLGGEGLMIRDPKSYYERKRSTTLLKIKKFYDAEAIVIGHEKGKGVNQHRCGALRCRMECGKEFSVGSGLSDKDRNKPPKIGTIITYKFQELTKSGSPRFPTFVGICIDKTEPKDAEIREILDEDEA